jgi:hypothetical protein
MKYAQFLLVLAAVVLCVSSSPIALSDDVTAAGQGEAQVPIYIQKMICRCEECFDACVKYEPVGNWQHVCYVMYWWVRVYFMRECYFFKASIT